jgi:Rrf2 family protein
VKLQVNTSLALFSVLEFAQDPTRHISAAEIAEKYGVSPHHLAKVLSELTRAGVVESVRGVGGGYRFAGNARRLTLMDVIRLFEDFVPEDAERRERRAGAPGAKRQGGASDRESPQAAEGSAQRFQLADRRPRRDPGERTPVGRALNVVLSEIDEIAKATMSSITLATMLRLVERQQRR